MNVAIDTDLLTSVERLGPLLRDHRDEGERERRPARQVMDALAGAGLFRMFTPRSLGGLELDPLTVAQVIEEISGHDSAAGWALMVANSVDWWCARLPDDGPGEIYARNPDAIIAAAFHPPQQAVAVEGGYRVSGRGPLASNIHDADWLLLTALVMDGDQPRIVDGGPVPIAAILPASEVEISDTWHALGMRGTDSNDVAVSDVFVPLARTFPLVPDFKPGTRYQAPLYRLPAMGEVGVVSAPVALAIARDAISEVCELARKKTPFGSAKVLRERSTVQVRLAKAEATLRAARLLFYDTLGEAWQRTLAGQPSSLEQKADLLLAAAHSVSSSMKVVELMYSVAGTSAIYSRSRLERHFRDIHTVRHHGFISESRYESVGQVYLGVPPEFALVMF